RDRYAAVRASELRVPAASARCRSAMERSVGSKESSAAAASRSAEADKVSAVAVFRKSRRSMDEPPFCCSQLTSLRGACRAREQRNADALPDEPGCRGMTQREHKPIGVRPGPDEISRR